MSDNRACQTLPEALGTASVTGMGSETAVPADGNSGSPVSGESTESREFDTLCRIPWIGGTQNQARSRHSVFRDRWIMSRITGSRCQVHRTPSLRFFLECDLPFDRRRVQNNGANAMKHFDHGSTDPGHRPPILAPRVHRSWDYEPAVPHHIRPGSSDPGNPTVERRRMWEVFEEECRAEEEELWAAAEIAREEARTGKVRRQRKIRLRSKSPCLPIDPFDGVPVFREQCNTRRFSLRQVLVGMERRRKEKSELDPSAGSRGVSHTPVTGE